MSKQMDRILRAAVDDGLLQSALAQPPAPSVGERHWSMIVFTGLAAWLSAVPVLVAVLFFVFKDSKVAGLVAGVPLLAVSVLILRARDMPLFVEQLGIPGLLASAILLGLQVYEWTDSEAKTFAAMALIACGVALAVDRAWLRTLLGAAVGLLTGASVLVATKDMGMAPCLPWLLVAGGWLCFDIWSRSIVLDAGNARRIAAMEAISSGLAAGCLLGLMWSGQTFLVGQVFGPDLHGAEYGAGLGRLTRFLSVATAVGAGAWLAFRWTALQAGWYVALLGVCALLAWFTPPLGIALLILFLCAENGRYGLAALAGVAGAWLIGSLYYDLHWPLAHKAMLLAGAGAAIALIGRYAIVAPAPLAQPDIAPRIDPAPARMDRRTRIGFLACGLLVLAAANTAIWQKESVIKTGAAVFVQLAPADPRSLMQGDYMRLRFALPASDYPTGRMPAYGQVVARTDSRGVAQLLRFYDGRVLARGEFLIDLVSKDGNWTLVTDAWYFKEGEAARWSRARYGEFRVAPDGHALLVGLRGPNLERL